MAPQTANLYRHYGNLCEDSTGRKMEINLSQYPAISAIYTTPEKKNIYAKNTIS